MSQTQPAGPGPAYRIGTAARLAGIPVATLRMWERRYAVAGPRTTASGHRRYSPAEVARLVLVKQLVDLGHPISAVAALADATLRELLAAAPGASVQSLPSRAPGRPLRVALVGESLVAQARAGAAAPGLQIAAECADRTDAARALAGAQADVLAIELPGLREDEIEQVAALALATGARRAVVAYRFATQPALHALRERGHVTVRAPLDLAELAALAGERPRAAPPLGPVPPRRYDDRALAAFARGGSTVRCECPRHLAELLASLAAFERYSAECAHRSPADAALHRYLERVAGTARALLEDALERVARADGLPVPGAAAVPAGSGT